MSHYFLAELSKPQLPDFTLDNQLSLIEEGSNLFVCDAISTGNSHVKPLVIAQLQTNSVIQINGVFYKIGINSDDLLK